MIYVRTPFYTQQQDPVDQPVQFDHRHHVGDEGIDCRYCHYLVEKSPAAGVPPTSLCLNCHEQIWNKSPKLAPVRESYFADRPIVWNKVNKLPHFVYFNHSIHVRQGVGCVTCHGRVDEMAQVEKAQSLAMGWCLECHRHPDGARRSLLHLLGASAALASLGGCLKPPDEKILPYTRQPPEVTPGNPLHYATAAVIDGRATGLLVTANEGRPTKIEGNPDHPSSRGAVGPLEQAELLRFYDPQRLGVVQHLGQPSAWRDFLQATAEKARALRDSRGAGLRFLMEPGSSPLVGRLRQRLADAYPQAKFSSWSAIPLQQIHDGAQLAYGAAYEIRLDLSRARV